MGKIGVFDSGFGGLTVLREIINLLPEYDRVYLGDSAKAPYGSKSSELVHGYTRQAVSYLFDNGCDLVILACNTASAEALRKIQQDYLPQHYPGKRVLGVIIPTVEKIVEDGKAKRVGVIATEGTVASETYVKEIHKLNDRLKVFQQATPLLVPLIEAGEISGIDLERHLHGYLASLLAKNVDSLILGCTHYALVEPVIRKVTGGKVKIYNQSAIVAEKLVEYLAHHPEIDLGLTRGSGTRYLFTDIRENHANFVESIMGEALDVSKVTIDC